MIRLWHLVTLPFRQRARRPLSARQPSRSEMGQLRAVPLGMEATDFSIIDQVNRRNDALERTQKVFARPAAGSFAAAASTHIDAMPEDETYAARFHRAYNKKEN